VLKVKGTVLLDTMQAIKDRAGEQEFHKIVSHLDEQSKKVFENAIYASSWYSLDALARFLEVDIRETANGDERELTRRSEVVIEKQHRGIYRMFIRLGSPEFVIKRIAAVHATYFDGVKIEVRMPESKKALIRYIGFERHHRIMEFAILGFFRKALEISGAKGVQAAFTTPLSEGREFCELTATWS
jgi:hypothetical protein